MVVQQIGKKHSRIQYIYIYIFQLLGIFLFIGFSRKKKLKKPTSQSCPGQWRNPVNIKHLPIVVPIVHKCPAKGISRIHGRSSVIWTCKNYSHSCHSKQPNLQKYVFRTVRHNKKQSKRQHKGQHPLSYGSLMQFHFQIWPLQHMLVLFWHYLLHSFYSTIIT